MVKTSTQKQGKRTPLRHEVIERLVARDADWAGSCSHDEILVAADMFFLDFFHADHLNLVLEVLEAHFTPQGIAATASTATEYTIDQLEIYGAEINPVLAKAITKMAVNYAVCIAGAMLDLPVDKKMPETLRFIERTVLNLAEKQLKKTGEENG